MNNPFFSIVIPSYNYGHLLNRALDSILDQKEAHYEVLIVDDGSTDNTREIAQQYTNQHPQISYISQHNAGPAKARNHGIKKSRGSYLIFLDADDALEKGALLKVESFLTAHGEIDCLLGGYTSIFPDGTTKHTPPSLLPDVPEKRLLAFLNKKIRVSNGAMVIKRHVFDTLSFPEDFRSCEDIPFSALVLLKFNCQSTKLKIARIYKHPDSLRHNHSAAEKYRILAVDKIFHSDIPATIKLLRKKFLAKAHLSVFRTLFLAGHFEEAQKNYLKAIKLYPMHLFNSSYLLKFLKSLRIAKK